MWDLGVNFPLILAGPILFARGEKVSGQFDCHQNTNKREGRREGK